MSHINNVIINISGTSSEMENNSKLGNFDPSHQVLIKGNISIDNLCIATKLTSSADK